MIVKASRRGGGQQLATHLLNAYDNERIEILEIRGALAPDLHGAFAEWRALMKATNAKKELYSLSVNPDPRQGKLTRDQYRDFIDRAEKRLGLDNQPRAVVFHFKKDKEGIPREHAHIVWSRIDAGKLRAVALSNDRYALRSVVREFARDHNLTLPRGVARDKTATERADARQHAENLQEKQQEERTGHSKEERRALISEAWHNTKGGRSFVSALEQRGYFLARGTTRSTYIVVDRFGEAYPLTRQIDGVRMKQLRERLVDYPLDKLPPANKAREFAAGQRAQALSLKQDFAQAANRQRDALAAFHRKRRAELDRKFAALQERHRLERETLAEAHAAEIRGVDSERLQKKPRGIKAFLTRITGISFLQERRQKRADKARDADHRAQALALEQRHEHEREDFRRHFRALRKVETREIRSCETALRRDRFRTIDKEFARALEDRSPQLDAITPPFNRAAGPDPARAGEMGADSLARDRDEQTSPAPERKIAPDAPQRPLPRKRPDPDRSR